MGRKRLDSLIVVDIEATCWEHESPPGETSEIIEIGVCLLEIGSGERTSCESLLVKPQSSSVSPFCTQLTSLTQEQVRGGVSFAEACDVLRKRFKSRNRVWASYGDYDRRQFQKQCERENVKYPFSSSHINIKALFALLAGLTREVGMAQALKHLGLDLKGRHHRGVDDAWNIAAIFSHLIKVYRF